MQREDRGSIGRSEAAWYGSRSERSDEESKKSSSKEEEEENVRENYERTELVI